MIDDFGSGDLTLNEDSNTAGASTTVVSGLPTTSVVGGVRSVWQQATGNLATSQVTVNSAAGTAAITPLIGLELDVDTRFHYDGIVNTTDETIGGALGLDLSGLGAIQITATALLVTADVSVSLYSNTQQTRTAPLVNGVTSIDLSTYTLNLSDIRAIRVLINDLTLLELVTIDKIEVVPVPEPTTGLLLAIGLAGLARQQRQRA